jgi:hypothetical protein
MQMNSKTKTELTMEFLPDACASKSDLIIEICGAMPLDMYHIFVMWYVDEMELPEIAFAMQTSEKDVHAKIKSGQGRILTALKREMADMTIDWSKCRSSEGPSIVAASLDSFVQRAFSEASLKNLVAKSIKAASKAASSEKSKSYAKPESGKMSSAPQRAVAAAAVTVVKPAATVTPAIATAPSAAAPASASVTNGTSANARLRARRKSGQRSMRAAIASSAAAFILYFKSSIPVQAAALATVGILVLGGGALILQHQSGDPDVTPALPESGPVRISTTQPPLAWPGGGGGASNTSAAITGPDNTGTNMPSQELPGGDVTIPEEEPADLPPLDPSDPEFVFQEAYVRAVYQGSVVLTGKDCNCGHVNPSLAHVENMDESRGTVTWVIRDGDNNTILYRGNGTTVDTALQQLYSVQGDGAYHIAFTYQVSDGLQVTKLRWVYIDTGSITRNQYA